MKPSFAAHTRISVSAAIAVLVAMSGAASAADQSPANVAETDFATLTLFAEPPGAHGMVRGALQIEMEPGWKTYWLDPGPSGIPPQIDFSGTAGIGKTAVLAPLPERFGEELARANGYKHDLALPFLLTPGEGETIDGAIVANVFLGICEEICVPVQAALSVDPSKSAATSTAVERAFAALPPSIASQDVTAAIDGDVLTLDLDSKAPVRDAFVLGPKGWYFGEAELSAENGGRTILRIPIDEKPKQAEIPELTVVLDDGDKGLTTVIRPE
ncbi:protein-disulfide reductase DsbD domain-containing protein [Fulvimarina sp. MAC3]|uniref:protein-disulfide reductase DsbD domain-containing protein n=1 Tax=Fulvimarina sp. MAC3 TaxID=3148887 RepID=UPI0031FCBF96